MLPTLVYLDPSTYSGTYFWTFGSIGFDRISVEVSATLSCNLVSIEVRMAWPLDLGLQTDESRSYPQIQLSSSS